MVTFGGTITFESSERSDTSNWVSRKLKEAGFVLVAFEGYTIKANRVSLLLDRGLFSGSLQPYTPANLLSKLRSEYGIVYDLKVQFANHLGVPWYFLCYQYNPEKALLVELTSKECKIVKDFPSIAEFGEWTKTYRDMNMLSSYQETGLPRIDVILRQQSMPWPGNLDTLLFYNGNLQALIEFQKTAKDSVKDHCNNKWFLPRGNRKGDVNRWKALDVIRLHAGLPLAVIVWSAREPDTIKFKVIENIVYPDQPGNRTPGLYYKIKKMVNFNELVQEIRTL